MHIYILYIQIFLVHNHQIQITNVNSEIIRMQTQFNGGIIIFDTGFNTKYHFSIEKWVWPSFVSYVRAPHAVNVSLYPATIFSSQFEHCLPKGLVDKFGVWHTHSRYQWKLALKLGSVIETENAYAATRHSQLLTTVCKVKTWVLMGIIRN